jgi:hypothetical protein
MANVKVRGCCCGIPFGCGVLVLALLATALWKLLPPVHLWSAGGIGGTLAFLIVPGVVLAVAIGVGAKRG